MKKILSMLAVAVMAVSALSSCIDDAEVTAYMTPDVKNEIASKDPDKVLENGIINTSCL